MDIEEMNANRLTLGGFAKLHRVSRETVRKWKRAGHLVMDGRHVVVDASNRRLGNRPRLYRGGSAKGPAGGVAEAGSEREVAALKIALMRLLAAGHTSGSVDQLIEAINIVLSEAP